MKVPAAGSQLRLLARRAREGDFVVSRSVVLADRVVQAVTPVLVTKIRGEGEGQLVELAQPEGAPPLVVPWWAVYPVEEEEPDAAES